MTSVYVVIENGDPYTAVYVSFASAAAAVKEKHAEEIDAQVREAEGGPVCSDVDVAENVLAGKTYLYIEKGIHIYIYKLSIIA